MMNLWDDIDKITNELRKYPTKILMLDFDGTLSHIANSPQEAVLLAEIKILVESLSRKKGFFVAIISGRNLKDLENKVGIRNIIYGGNHGLEGRIFDKKYTFPIQPQVLESIRDLKSKIEKIPLKFSSTLVEDKQLALSFHYKKAQKQDLPAIKSLLNQILRPYLKKRIAKIIIGKDVYDICPNVDWDKGDFANLLIKRIGTFTKEKNVPIFIGDDKSDENVFRKLNSGITIKVGKDLRSNAMYILKNTSEVHKFLEWLNIVSTE